VIKVPSYTEDDVQYALRDIVNGTSERQASRDWGVNRGVLQQRIKGRVSRSESHAHLQRLAPVQEQRLTDWVLVQESFGRSPTHSQIRASAGRILAARHDTLPLGNVEQARSKDHT
jgi:hypothetical protein